MSSRNAAELIWNKYERYLSPLLSEEYNGPAACDKGAFIDTVTMIIDAEKRNAVNSMLDEAINSGDGTYKP